MTGTPRPRSGMHATNLARGRGPNSPGGSKFLELCHARSRLSRLATFLLQAWAGARAFWPEIGATPTPSSGLGPAARAIRVVSLTTGMARNLHHGNESRSIA